MLKVLLLCSGFDTETTEMGVFFSVGNVPFDISVLARLYPKSRHITDKARALEAAGCIVRLKKGMYVAGSNETGKPLSRELIANHLYGPSYIGREYALRYYGLIPERVYLMTSVTTKAARSFENATGSYSYVRCSKEYFPVGVRILGVDGINFLIASEEKALCDVINFSKNLNLRYLKDVESYLENDIRFDMDELLTLNIDLLEECAKVSRRRGSIETLIKYIKHEQHIQ